MKKSIVVITATLVSLTWGNALFATPDTWTQKADFGGTGRSGAIGFSIGDKGYIGTGTDVATVRKDFWSTTLLLMPGHKRPITVEQRDIPMLASRSEPRGI